MKSAIPVVAMIAAGILFGHPYAAWGQDGVSQGGGTVKAGACAEKRGPELFVFDFFSAVSADCADIKPIVQKAERRFAQRVKIIHVDVNHPRNQSFIDSVGVQSVPTLLVVNTSGDQLKTLTGRHQSNVLPILLETLLPDGDPPQQAQLQAADQPLNPVALVRQDPHSDPES